MCSLQYTDRACNGLYDVWGRFEGMGDNTPAAEFPTLATLSEISYDKDSIREVEQPLIVNVPRILPHK